MIRLDSVFIGSDIFLAPLCFVVLLMVFSAVIKKYQDDATRNLFLKAFYFKMGVTLLWTIFSSFYYSGGDSEMYYFSCLRLHKAVIDDPDNFMKIYTTKVINVKTPLMNYFIYNESRYPEFEAMHGAGNFFVPKLGLPFCLLFNKSYLCISMSFSFFALGGCIRLYKFFMAYFPQYRNEIILATLFIPSMVFWSAGMLKDPICLGSVGFLVYGMYSLVVRRKKIVASLLWVATSGILLYFIKPYILLALLPAIMLWVFSQFNKLISNKTLRNIFAGMTLIAGVLAAFFMINYTTSDESLQSFRLDAIIETSNYNRSLYEGFSETEQGSYFTIKTSNPLLLFLNGIIATFFRPFPWEISSVIVILSAAESMFFLFFTLSIVFKRGIFYLFKKMTGHPVFLLCFVFSFVFAAAVGSTATNFGSLSRYKIPCLPFYLIMILIIYREAGLKYPNWVNKLLGYKKSFNRLVS